MGLPVPNRGLALPISIRPWPKAICALRGGTDEITTRNRHRGCPCSERRWDCQSPIAAWRFRSRSDRGRRLFALSEGERMRSPRETVIAAALAASADGTASPQSRLAACDLLIREGIVESVLPTLRDLTAVPTCAGRARLLLRTGEYFVRRGLL